MTHDRTGGEPAPVDVYVGSMIKRRRIECGLSQDELGQRIGLTFQQIQKYERGANRVSASRLFDIAEALEVPPAYFFPQSKTDTVHPVDRHRRSLELVRNFDGIPDEEQRKSVYALVKSLSRAPLRAEDQPVAAE